MWRTALLAGLVISPCQACHAQNANNWSTRIQALPQVVPEAARVIPPAPAAHSSSWGTGFVIAPGYVLTAGHVVSQRNQIRVGPVGQTESGQPRWLSAELVKVDVAQDLALLKIPEKLPSLKLNAANTTPIGIEAFVIGYPQPRIQGASRKITAGNVNGYRNMNMNQPDQGLLQISAEVSRGNSGGPVIAPDGTVIGMVQQKINTSRTAEKVQDFLVNVSFALRSAKIVDFLRSTEVAYETQPLRLDTALRPYQIFDMHQQSVLAVIGRWQKPEAPLSEHELPKEHP